VNAFVKACAAVPVAIALAAASSSVFSTAEAGLWEISRSGSPPVKICVPNTAVLAQFEHRHSRCSRTIIRDSGSAATVNYTCADGDFGQSDVRLVTPRALSIQTQGISGNAPFKYSIQARRVGDCPSH
jgi:hypothetical protein